MWRFELTCLFPVYFPNLVEQPRGRVHREESLLVPGGDGIRERDVDAQVLVKGLKGRVKVEEIHHGIALEERKTSGPTVIVWSRLCRPLAAKKAVGYKCTPKLSFKERGQVYPKLSWYLQRMGTSVPLPP